MKKSTIAVMLIVSAVWAFPIHAASALKEQNHVSTQTINYEHFHVSRHTEEHQPSNKATPRKSTSPVSSTTVGVYRGRHYSKAEVEALIRQYAQQYGIQPEGPLCIAWKESGYNQFSKNRNSTASGVFQYLSGTWKATDEGLAGLSVFDAEANVRAAIKYMSSRKSTKPWVVGKSCPPIKTIN